MGRVEIDIDTQSLTRAKAYIVGKGKEYEKKLSKEVNKAVKDLHRGVVNRFNSNTNKEYFPHAFKAYQQRIQPKFYTDKPVADVVADTEIMAYLEFGTGKYAKEYLTSQNAEVRELAQRFFKTGKGTLREFSYLIPTFYENRNKIIERLKKVDI